MGIPLTNTGIDTVIANFDGPYYIVVSKTFYDKTAIRRLFSFPLPLEYYPAHFPLFPFLIRLVSPILGSGPGMLFLTLAGTILATIAAYELFLQEGLAKLSLPATLTFLILPARWLVVHTVGSPEPWFIFFILLSLLSFSRKKYLFAAVAGSLATLTKSPGVLLFVAFFLKISFDFIIKKQKISLKTFSLFLIPTTLFCLFLFYYLRTGDFLAYFHSGDNIHLQLLPFQVFNSHQAWVGSFWLEDVVYVYLLAGLGLALLLSKRSDLLCWFYGTFLASLIFVSHRDISRYSLPLAPLAILAFSPILKDKKVRLLMIVVFVPAYLYSINFISQNIVPISNWSPLR